MRTAALLLALLASSAAIADVVDLGGGESRRGSGKPRTFAFRAEVGTEFSPYGNLGGVFSYFNEVGIGGFELEVGAGTTLKDNFTPAPGVQLGLAVRQLLGETGDYFVFELSIAGNTKRKLGADSTQNRLTESSTWTSLGIGFEHRAGLLSFGVVAGLSFITAFDFVPHGMLHGGFGLAF